MVAFSALVNIPEPTRAGAFPEKYAPVRRVHLPNALSPMLVKPLPITTLVRLVHQKNASTPMLVTLLGNVTPVRLVHQLNAAIQMLVTLSGIV